MRARRIGATMQVLPHALVFLLGAERVLGYEYTLANGVLGEYRKSQFGEELALYEQFFSKTRGGTYVEMGALDGVTFSNTFAYEKVLGWKGVLIEANPHSCKQLLKNRKPPGATPVCTAISNDSRTVEFEFGKHPAVFAMTETMSSQYKKTWHPPPDTVSAEEKLWMPHKTPSGKKVSVPSAPLGKVLREHLVAASIDFFSLDVEGSELQVLQTMDWNIPVRVWCIEVQPETEHGVRRLMRANGYHKCGWMHDDDGNLAKNHLYVRLQDDIMACRVRGLNRYRRV